MHSNAAKALAWSIATIVGLGAASGSGCSTTKPTELVPGVISQVVVPRDLGAVRLTVSVNGQVKFDQGYDVGAGGTVKLPSTLGVVSGQNAGAQVAVTIRGYDLPCAQVGPDCIAPGVSPDLSVGPNQGHPRVLRPSVQTFVDQHTLFLPMPLSYSCFDSDCSAQSKATGKDLACRGGTCVETTANSSKLADFDPALINGMGICFSPAQCFPHADPTMIPSVLAPVLIDADQCIYGLPAAVAQAPGLNVRVFYEDVTWTANAASGLYDPTAIANAGEQEILDQEPADSLTEGFAVLPNQQIQLAPGLCSLVKNATPPTTPPTNPRREISDVQVSIACPSKVQLLPICAAELNPPATLPDGGATSGVCAATTTASDGGASASKACSVCNVAVPLVPTTSAIYLVMDDSEAMHGAYGTNGYVTAAGLSLTDPVFKRTFAGLKFLPHDPLDCTSTTPTSFLTPDVPFALASAAQGQIALKIGGWSPPEAAAAGIACATSADCPAGASVCLGASSVVSGGCYTPAPLDLEAAMRLDTGAYGAVLNQLKKPGTEAPNVAATMFFVNRIPDSTGSGAFPGAPDCKPPLGGTSALNAIEAEVAAAFNNTPSLKTYFVVLNNDLQQPPTAFFQQVQSDSPAGAVTTLDATTTDGKQVLANFAKAFAQLGTCLYGVPTGVTSTVNTTVQYGPPGAIAGTQQTVIPTDTTCSAATKGTANGWNVDNGHIRICGTACTNFQNFLLGVSANAQQNNQKVPDVPLGLTTLCPGTAAPASSDAGASSAKDSGVDAAVSNDASGG